MPRTFSHIPQIDFAIGATGCDHPLDGAPSDGVHFAFVCILQGFFSLDTAITISRVFDLPTSTLKINRSRISTLRFRNVFIVLRPSSFSLPPIGENTTYKFHMNIARQRTVISAGGHTERTGRTIELALALEHIIQTARIRSAAGRRQGCRCCGRTAHAIRDAAAARRRHRHNRGVPLQRRRRTARPAGGATIVARRPIATRSGGGGWRSLASGVLQFAAHLVRALPEKQRTKSVSQM